MNELKAAFRALWATPLVSLVVILSLALGLGANIAISLVDSLLVRALPVSQPDRLAQAVTAKRPGTVLRTRFIADVTVCQRVSSAASCFLPAAVSS